LKRPTAIPSEPTALTEFATIGHMIRCFQAWGCGNNYRIDSINETSFRINFWFRKCGYLECTVDHGFLIRFIPNDSAIRNHQLPSFEITSDLTQTFAPAKERWERNRRRITNTGLMPIAESEGECGLAFRASPERRRKWLYLRYDKLFARFARR
jgi:hypothetical protein